MDETLNYDVQESEHVLSEPREIQTLGPQLYDTDPGSVDTDSPINPTNINLPEVHHMFEDDLSFTPPPEWSSSLEAVAPGVGSVLQDTNTGGEAWYDQLLKIIPALAATYQQKQLLEIQAQRARQGLPPLNMSQYQPGINVGLAPQTQTLLIVGGVALLAVLYFARKR